MLFHCTISRIKGDRYYIQTRYKDFFSHCNPSYSGKTLRKIASKRAHKYWASISGGAHAALGIPQYFLILIIVIRGDWLWKATNINDKNNSAAVYVGSTLKVHNPLFSVRNSFERCALSGPQKHITNESDGFHNHSTQLTMVLTNSYLHKVSFSWV